MNIIEFNDEDFEQVITQTYLFKKPNCLRYKNLKLPNHISIQYDKIFDFNFQENTYFSTDIKNAHFECFLRTNPESKYLWIFLSAARTNLRKLPHFDRISYINLFEENCLFVEDPMYFEFPSLHVGWFWGTKNVSYRKLTADLITNIVKNLKIPSGNVIIYGSSCAGTAAIDIAKELKSDCLCVCFNGQYDFITKNKHFDDFIRNTGINIYEEDKEFGRNNITKIIRRDIQELRSFKLLLCNNLFSKWDNSHLKYLFNMLETISNPSLGLNTYSDNFCVWNYLAIGKNPHGCFDNQSVFLIIRTVCILFLEKQLNYYSKYIYDIFTDFWFDTFTRTESIFLNISSKFDKQLSDIIFKKEKIVVVETNNSDRNKHYSYTIKYNGMYRISFKIDNVSCQKFTIGVYDKFSKQYLFKNNYDRSEREVALVFIIYNYRYSDFCVFAGVQGETQGNVIEFSNFQVCYS